MSNGGNFMLRTPNRAPKELIKQHDRVKTDLLDQPIKPGILELQMRGINGRAAPRQANTVLTQLQKITQQILAAPLKIPPFLVVKSSK